MKLDMTFWSRMRADYHFQTEEVNANRKVNGHWKAYISFGYKAINSCYDNLVDLLIYFTTVHT